MAKNELVPLPSAALVQASEVPSLLGQIRGTWQAKNLIERVRRLLEVDPSSACQRLFNAALHDLREKIVIAGIDIASEAATQNGLPPVKKAEDIEHYPGSKLIDLSYRMGLISRPDWKRISRCYDIRGDLEHEDDEYEAGIEDCIYIFKTCIEVVLSRDPIHLLKVKDVKDLVEQSSTVTPDRMLIEDFYHAPQPRQEEIIKFLISITTDPKKPDIVQQNGYIFLTALGGIAHNAVKLKITTYYQETLGRQRIDHRQARVAIAAGIFPYLRQQTRTQIFEDVYAQMEKVGPRWTAHAEHGELLRSFGELGGLKFCPLPVRQKILQWLVLTYLGERGGTTSYGNVRPVFYSNSAAPLITNLIEEAKDQIAEELRALQKAKVVSELCANQHIARRYERLLDLLEVSSEAQPDF